MPEKTVYILVQHHSNGKQRRVGVWAKRATAESNQRKWENWTKYGYLSGTGGSTFEIIEETRLV